MTCARPTGNAAAGGETSVAYYFGKLTGTDLVIDAGDLSRPLLAGTCPTMQRGARFDALT